MVEALSRENLLEFLRMRRLSSNSKDRKPLEWMIVVRSGLPERVIRRRNGQITTEARGHLFLSARQCTIIDQPDKSVRDPVLGLLG